MIKSRERFIQRIMSVLVSGDGILVQRKHLRIFLSFYYDNKLSPGLSVTFPLDTDPAAKVIISLKGMSPKNYHIVNLRENSRYLQDWEFHGQSSRTASESPDGG